MSTSVPEPDWDPAVAGGEAPSFYLAFEGGAGAHACWAWRHLTAPDGRRFAVATIASDRGYEEDVVVVPRHAGMAIDPPSEFPLYVHVARAAGALPREDGARIDPTVLEASVCGAVVPTWDAAVELVDEDRRADEASRGGPVA